MGETSPLILQETKRLVVPAAEQCLYDLRKIGQSGHVNLIDYMGGDASVVRVATAGHGLGIFGKNAEALFGNKFIEDLVCKGILHPFYSVQFKFDIQAPISVALALVYAREASVNEYSGRYSRMPETAFVPDVETLKTAMMEQGLTPGIAQQNAEAAIREITDARKRNYGRYAASVDEEGRFNLARELARAPLQTSNDTKFFWKIRLPDLVSLIERYRAMTPEYMPLHQYLNALEERAYALAPGATQALFNFKMGALNHTFVGLSLKMPLDEEVVDPPLKGAFTSPAKTKRPVVKALEDLLFAPVEFLKEGQVQAFDYMGYDTFPADSARISYGTGTVRVSEDRHLIRHLLRNLHTTPFEHGEVSFEVKAPIFVFPRQAGRHRMLPWHGFMGEVPFGSRVFFPEDDQWRRQSKSNRQGRGELLPEELKDECERSWRKDYAEQDALVARLRELRVPEGLVRDAKSFGHFTRAWVTGDVKNWLHYLGLRLDAHAQREIQILSHLQAPAIEALSPSTFGAFQDYVRKAVRLSAQELPAVASLLGITPENVEDIRFYERFKFTRKKKGKTTGESTIVLNREGEELQEKLRILLALKSS